MAINLLKSEPDVFGPLYQDIRIKWPMLFTVLIGNGACFGLGLCLWLECRDRAEAFKTLLTKLVGCFDLQVNVITLCSQKDKVVEPRNSELQNTEKNQISGQLSGNQIFLNDEPAK